MIISIIISIIVSAFLILPLIKTPLIITLIIILIRIILALIFRLSISSWYAFLIFLIYVRGMLVIFAYFTATTPNQSKLHIKSTIYILILSLITLSFISSYWVSEPLINLQKYQITNIFSAQNIYILIIITLILLFTIVVIVKLTTRSKGPIRSFK